MPSLRRKSMVVVATLTVASTLGWWFGDQRRTRDAEYRVVEVLDGDTIVVARGNRRDTIRLLGIDTPETHHPTKPVQCFGPEASEYTTRRLSGQRVRLEDDVETHDIYGRHLAYVYLARCNASKTSCSRRATRDCSSSSRTTRTPARCSTKSSTLVTVAGASGPRAKPNDRFRRELTQPAQVFRVPTVGRAGFGACRARSRARRAPLHGCTRARVRGLSSSTADRRVRSGA